MAVTDPATRLAAFRERHPCTRFVDVLLADLCGTPRGKRVAIADSAPISGNAYQNAVATLPTTRPEAALKFEGSALMREYLGEKLHRLFVTTRRGELQTFESQVTPLEYAWYARTC